MYLWPTFQIIIEPIPAFLVALDSGGNRVDAGVSFILLVQIFEGQLVVQRRSQSIRNDFNVATKRLLRLEVVGKAARCLGPNIDFITTHRQKASQPAALPGLMALRVKMVSLHAPIGVDYHERGVSGVSTVIDDRRIQAEMVNLVQRRVAHKAIQVHASPLSDGVSVWPFPHTRGVDPVFIQHQIGCVFSALCGEPEGVQGGSRTRDTDGLAKGAVFIPGGDVAGCGTN